MIRYSTLLFIKLDNGLEYAIEIGYNDKKYSIRKGCLYKGMFKKLGRIVAIRQGEY